jgi:hypothetical protein
LHFGQYVEISLGTFMSIAFQLCNTENTHTLILFPFRNLYGGLNRSEQSIALLFKGAMYGSEGATALLADPSPLSFLH